MITRTTHTLTLLLLLAAGSLSSALAQTPGNLTISAGYFGHFAIWPGAKVGLHYDLKQWSKDKPKGVKTTTLFVSPQAGFYTRPRFHTTYLINGEAGIRRQREDKKAYSAFSGGLGYLAQMEIMTITVNLSGETTGKEREHRGYLVPTLSYEFGRAISPRTGLYAKVSYGTTVSSSREWSGIAFLELGVKFRTKSSAAE